MHMPPCRGGCPVRVALATGSDSRVQQTAHRRRPPCAPTQERSAGPLAAADPCSSRREFALEIAQKKFRDRGGRSRCRQVGLSLRRHHRREQAQSRRPAARANRTPIPRPALSAINTDCLHRCQPQSHTSSVGNSLTNDPHRPLSGHTASAVRQWGCCGRATPAAGSGPPRVRAGPRLRSQCQPQPSALSPQARSHQQPRASHSRPSPSPPVARFPAPTSPSDLDAGPALRQHVECCLTTA
jgi:hypothetical protein